MSSLEHRHLKHPTPLKTCGVCSGFDLYSCFILPRLAQGFGSSSICETERFHRASWLSSEPDHRSSLDPGFPSCCDEAEDILYSWQAAVCSEFTQVFLWTKVYLHQLQTHPEVDQKYYRNWNRTSYSSNSMSLLCMWGINTPSGFAVL